MTADASETSAGHPPQEPEAETPEAADPGGRGFNWLSLLRFFRRKTPRLWVTEGNRLLESHNLNQANMAFHHALELDDACADAHRGLGRVSMQKGGKSNLVAALGHFHNAIRLDPFDEQTFHSTAILYDRLGRSKEAQQERKKMVVVRTLKANPENAVAQNNVGIILLRLEQFEQAIPHFRRSLTLDPHYEVALRNLAITYCRMAQLATDPEISAGLLTKAQGAMSTALTMTESAPNCVTMGRILVAQGRHEEALRVLGKAQELEPAYKDIYLLKKISLEALGRMTEAQKAHEEYHAFLRRPGA